MSNPTPLVRLIVCVDGARSSHLAFGNSNAANIARIARLVREGPCSSSDGHSIQQVLIYTQALEETAYNNREVEAQIELIARNICQVLKSPQDEVFLFGSGHGGYIVRAIAGVLHHMGLPKAWSLVRFHENYLDALDLYKARCEEDSTRGLKLVKGLKAQCYDPPVVKFVGVFDTIRKKIDTLAHDLTFNPSTKIFRHALALNEGTADRVNVTTSGDEDHRSLIQAWFMGSSDDLCGGVQHDGLSLYPLQWMLLESVQAGLVFHSAGTADLEENPLALAFPHHVGQIPKVGSDENIEWRSEYKNGIKVSMFDLQPAHATSWTKGKNSHTVHLKGEASFYPNPRRAFNARGLLGWSDQGVAATIIHPSVYCLLDRYPRLQGNPKLKALKTELADFQERCMKPTGNTLPPWLEDMQLQANGVKAFRILVCGKTGVGKSTLINRVFGVELTEESNSYDQGVHDINQAFESPSHPGLLIHDSRGWQAGSNQELELIAQFLRRRAFQKDPAEALHVIWFCVDSDVSRIEEADRRTFEIITQYSYHVPIFIVGTKKDKIASIRKMQLLEQYLESDTLTDVKKTNQLVTQETEDHVKNQFSELISQFSKIRHYRADAHLCLSKNDDTGIKDLLNQTLGLISDERVRLFCVAAQVVSVDQKIGSAISETIRLGTHAVRTAMIPLPCSGIIATPTVSRLLCEHILQCFGFPKATPEAVEEIMSRVVMSNLKSYMAVAVTQFIALGGCVFAAPPAARMLLKCACDMLLILERSFRYGGKFVSVKQIEDAARYYTKTTVKTFGGKDQLLQQHVHEEVDKMLPLTSVTTAWRFAKLRVGLEEIIYSHRFEKSSIHGRAELSSSAQISELDGRSMPAELGDRASIAELEGTPSTLPRSEYDARSSDPPSPYPAPGSIASSHDLSSSASTRESVHEVRTKQDVNPSRLSRTNSDVPPGKSRQPYVSRFSSRFSLRKTKTLM